MTPSSPTRLRTAVVVLNYRTPDLVVDCVRTVVPQLEAGRDVVVVVENGSGDDSALRLREAIDREGWSAWVRLLDTGTNLGFSGGNNAGAAAVDAEALLFLNSDTLVREGAIARLRAVVSEHGGLASPRLLDAHGDEQPNRRTITRPAHELARSTALAVVGRSLGHRPPDPAAAGESPVPAPWISFAAMMVAGDTWRTVGPLDDGFFMYFEDMDYCLRAHAAGHAVHYVPDAEVVHLQGGSSDVQAAGRRKARRPRFYYLARARYFAKHFGVAGLWTANLLWTVGRPIGWLRERVQPGVRIACAGEWRDLWVRALRPLAPWSAEELHW